MLKLPQSLQFLWLQSFQCPRLGSIQWWKWSIAASAMILTHITTQSLFDRTLYHQGRQAYQDADCEYAILMFDRVMNSPRLLNTPDDLVDIEATRSECLEFQKVMDLSNSKEIPNVLLAYDEFVDRYPTSILTQTIRQQAATIYKQSDPSGLVNLALCNKMASLEINQLIPESSAAMSHLLYACGRMYTDQGDYENAIAQYQQYLQMYPNEAQIADVEVSLKWVKLLQAEDLAAQGNYADAINLYRALLSISEDDEWESYIQSNIADVMLAEARAAIANGDFMTAIGQYQDWLYEFPGHKAIADVKAALNQAKVAEARIAITQRRYQDAIRLYRQVLGDRSDQKLAMQVKTELTRAELAETHFNHSY